jgi:hypothetical protein
LKNKHNFLQFLCIGSGAKHSGKEKTEAREEIQKG